MRRTAARDSDSTTTGGFVIAVTSTIFDASFWRFRIGVPSMINPLDYLRGRRGNWYSDLADSKEILFWEVK
ncbi:hypothetical protein FPJ27_11140 [Burkholderia sp. MS455]|nr:hypothetical protein FPJ27_11140 [Burkholderia sp. MS455]